MALGAVLAWWLPKPWLDWQPSLAAHQPWRVLTGAWVHWSPQHLGANLAGCLALGFLGHSARLRWRPTLAWLLAWPLTQIGLWLRPELLHFGGLSGVLHAGVVICAGQLLLNRRPSERLIGLLLLLGLGLKVWGEQPLGPALQSREDWDILIAPFSHLSGAVMGGLCAALLLRRPPPGELRSSGS